MFTKDNKACTQTDCTNKEEYIPRKQVHKARRTPSAQALLLPDASSSLDAARLNVNTGSLQPLASTTPDAYF